MKRGKLHWKRPDDDLRNSIAGGIGKINVHTDITYGKTEQGIQ